MEDANAIEDQANQSVPLAPPDNAEKYYNYLKSNGADVPPSYDSFHKTLSDESSAQKYYGYLKSNGFDTPDSFDSFQRTLGFGGAKPAPVTSGISSAIPLSQPSIQVEASPFVGNARRQVIAEQVQRRLQQQKQFQEQQLAYNQQHPDMPVQQIQQASTTQPADQVLSGENTRSLPNKIAQAVKLPAFNKGAAEDILRPLDAASTVIDDAMGDIYTGITGKPYTSQKGGGFGKLADNYEQNYENRDKPNGVVGDIVEGLAQTVPLIAGTTLTGGEGLAVSGAKLTADEAMPVVSHLTKYLAATGALNAYGESRNNGNDVMASTVDAAKGGAKGAVKGLALEAQMLVGKAFGGKTFDYLDKKLDLSNPKTVEALLNAVGVGSVFGGTSVGTDVANGQPINWRNAATQLGMGAAFESPGIFNGVSADIDQHIQDSRNEAKVTNFIKSTPEQINAIMQLPFNSAELQAKSLEKGIQASDLSEDQQTKGHLAQLGLQNSADIKSTVENILDNKDRFIAGIIDSKLPEDTQTQLLDKVKQVYDSFTPFEKQKQDLGQKIKILDGQIAQHTETIKTSIDPVTQADAEVRLEQVNNQREQLFNQVKQLIKLKSPDSHPVEVAKQQEGIINPLSVTQTENGAPDEIPDPTIHVYDAQGNLTNRLPDHGLHVYDKEGNLENIHPGISTEQNKVEVDETPGNIGESDGQRVHADAKNESPSLSSDFTETSETTLPDTNINNTPAESLLTKLDEIQKANNEPKPIKPGKERQTTYKERSSAVLDNDPRSLREAILHYFIGGGKISTEDFKRFTGTNVGSEDGRQYLSLIKNANPADRDAGGSPLDYIAEHHIPDTYNKDTHETSNEIINTMQEFGGSRNKMLAELERLHSTSHGENGHTAEELHSYGQLSDEEREIVDKIRNGQLSDSEVEHLLSSHHSDELNRADDQVNDLKLTEHTINELSLLLDKYTNTAGRVDWDAIEKEFEAGDLSDLLQVEEIRKNEKDTTKNPETDQRTEGPTRSKNDGSEEANQGPRKLNIDSLTPEQADAFKSDGLTPQDFQDFENAKYEEQQNQKSILDQVFDQGNVKDVLHYLDSFKIKSEGIKSKILPVAELYNAAIEVVKAAIKTGNTLRNTLILAKDFLREQGSKDDEINGFVRSITSKVDLEKADKNPTIKQIIKDNTDRRAKTKVVLTELHAIKKQMTDRFRGFNAGVKDGTIKERQVVAGKKAIIDGLRADITGALLKAKSLGVFRGDVSGNTLANVLKKITDAGSSESKLTNIVDNYLPKVLENTEYDKDIQQAKKTRQQIQNKLNSKTFEKSVTAKELVKAFLRIQPRNVNDIKEYNQIAARILDNQKGLKVDEKTSEISNDLLAISNKEIEDYTNKQLASQQQQAKDKLLSDYQKLVDSGVIDKDAMSLSQMKAIVKASEAGDTALDELAAEEKADNAQQTKSALKQLISAKVGNLDNYLEEQRVPGDDGFRKSTLTADEKDIIDNLKKIDTSDLSFNQMVKLNDVLNNITENNDFAGSGQMAVLADAQRSRAELDKKVTASGIELGSVGNVFVKGFASTQLMHEFIFKSSKVAGEAQRLTGISDVFNGHARAKLEQNRTMDAYNDLKKHSSKGIDSPENRYRRGIYARIIQHFGGTPAEQAAEFDRVKNLIKQTAEKLSKSDEKDYPGEIKEGKIVQQVYDELLKDSNSPEEVRAKLEKIKPDNIKLVDFWQNKFGGISDNLQASTELYNNKPWEDIENYTPTKMKAVNGGSLTATGEAEPDMFASQYFKKNIDDTAASTKIKRTRSNTLPKNAAFDLDFDKVVSRKYYESNYDIETSKAISKVRAMLTDPKVAELFGGNKNLKTIKESIKRSVDLQKGDLPVPKDFEKALLSATNILTAKAARIALGSTSQLLKQYASVALNTLVNLNQDLPLYFKALSVGNEIELFDKFNIGQRGSTQAGYNKEADLRQVDGIKFQNDMNTGLSKVAELSKKVAEKSLYLLEKSDVSVAKTSWLAWYMQDMKNQGIDINNIDWKNEHEHPNEEAAAYAEQQVSRNQNPNDASSMGDLYKNKGNAYANIFKNIFLPFSTFSVNQRVRFANDIQKLVYGGEKAEAAKSIIATTTEQVVFNYLKTYLIASATTAGANALLHAFGINDADKEDKSKLQRFAANTFSDVFYTGMGNVNKELLERGSNSLYNMLSDDKKTQLFYQYDPNKYGQPDFSPYGMYAVLPTKVNQASQMAHYLTGETTKITKGGTEHKHQEHQVDMKPNEAALAKVMFTIDALGLVGVSDADVLQINQKAEVQFKQHLGQHYGGSYNMKIYTTKMKAPKNKPNKK